MSIGISAQAEQVAIPYHNIGVLETHNELTSASVSEAVELDSRNSSLQSPPSDGQDIPQSQGLAPWPSVDGPDSYTRRTLKGVIEQVENKFNVVRQNFDSFAVQREEVKNGFQDRAVERFLVDPKIVDGEYVKIDKDRFQYVPYDWMKTAIKTVDDESQKLQDSIQDLLLSVRELSDIIPPVSFSPIRSHSWPEMEGGRRPQDFILMESLPEGVRISEDLRSIVDKLCNMSIQTSASPALGRADTPVVEEHALLRALADFHSARRAVQELLFSSFESEEEERAVRDLRRDQDQELAETDKAVKRRYRKARAPLNQQIKHLNQQIDSLTAICRAENLDLTIFEQQPHVDDVLIDDTIRPRSRASSTKGRQDDATQVKIEAWRASLDTT